MELIEMMVVMGKNRMIQLPEEEVNVMGLKEGDELCLSYLVDDRMEGKVNEAGGGVFGGEGKMIRTKGALNSLTVDNLFNTIELAKLCWREALWGKNRFILVPKILP